MDGAILWNDKYFYWQTTMHPCKCPPLLWKEKNQYHHSSVTHLTFLKPSSIIVSPWLGNAPLSNLSSQEQSCLLQNGQRTKLDVILESHYQKMPPFPCFWQRKHAYKFHQQQHCKGGESGRKGLTFSPRSIHILKPRENDSDSKVLDRGWTTEQGWPAHEVNELICTRFEARSKWAMNRCLPPPHQVLPPSPWT